jgi:long-chain acyl-CoA synthetase
MLRLRGEEPTVAADTIVSRLFRNAEETPTTAAYREKVGGEYAATSWGEYADQVRRAGLALIALGVQPGDVVTILGFNRPEWVVMHLAAMAVGGAPAGIYTTSSPDEVHYVTNHSASPVILVENEVQLAKVLSRRSDLPHLRWIVTMRGAPAHDDEAILTWDEFLARSIERDDAEFFARIDALEPDGLAVLIYTSGTTGPPKGVMLTHHNLTWTSDGASGIFDIRADDRLISYLPLSHIAEQIFTIHGAMTYRYCVSFAESIEALPEDIKEVQPTLFFGVPRVWEKFRAGVASKLAEASGLKGRIAGWAMAVGREAVALQNAGREPSGLLAAKYRLADRLLYRKVKAALGLDACRVAVSGAAPIDPSVLEFFAGLDLPIYEVYGQSEGTGPTTFNGPGRARFGAAGPPFPGTEVRIADDGEILLRGGNVFAGYFRNPEATAETLVDGWLHSGDLGRMEDDGMLTITGRKKDIIITAGGKNIAPRNFEGALKQNPLVTEAVVIGDRRKYLTALVTLDQVAAAAFLAERGESGPAQESPAVLAEVAATVDEINARFARVEQIKKFRILPREFSIEEGEVTGTLKVKRDVVADHFSAEIEAMYVE